MDRIRVLDACRRDGARLAKAYRLHRIGAGAVELWPEDAREPSTSMGAQSFDASPWLDHELFGLLPLGWHAATNERGAVLLQCAPEPVELLIEAGNLIERMAAGKEPAPADWPHLSQDRRCDLLAVRLMVEPETARLIAQRVIQRLARLQSDRGHT
ncbi:hypothetical protein [Azohydromonas lata]|uniref:Uncharacterized protein n=1 Tax=Azohydromonas lata TaxID=45677 RepID=A0ABU5I8C6_9BURK|nr:hypothetical protein [Azohydromonas lata]MDZ5455338.1 hypothetical protein [Azohydromonas lata]